MWPSSRNFMTVTVGSPEGFIFRKQILEIYKMVKPVKCM
jgi:hypothetical protein